MLAELEREHYQLKVGYLGFMKQYFICVQLISVTNRALRDLLVRSRAEGPYYFE